MALDVLVLLRLAMEGVRGDQIEGWALIDSKYLHKSLTTQRRSVDRSVSGNVNCIRFVFETKIDSKGWTRGSCNPLDVGTKPSRPLTDAVALLLVTGRIHADLSVCKTKSSNCNLA